MAVIAGPNVNVLAAAAEVAKLTAVATPRTLPVVLTVFHKLTVVCVPTTVGLLSVIVPLVVPTAIVVAAPNRLPVVANVLNTAAVVTPVLVCKVAVPVVALPRIVNVLLPAVVPMLTAAAAPPMLVVLAPPVAKFNVPVVIPVHSLTIPVVTSLVKLIVPPAVELISNVLPVIAGPNVSVLNAAALVAMLTAVPTPNKLPVVIFVLTKLNVVPLAVKSPPSILTSPSTSRLFLILVVPVAAPIAIAVPAPAKFTVVAVAFNRLNVV